MRFDLLFYFDEESKTCFVPQHLKTLSYFTNKNTLSFDIL